MTAMSPFSRIIYFGDSLTDNGGLFDLTSTFLTIPLPPAQLGFDGQFSDGDVYADIAADLLGAQAENFAIGGAQAIGEVPVGSFFEGSEFPDGFMPFTAVPTPEQLAFDINLNGQVDRFLASEAARGTPIPGSAASFFIGLNDLNGFTPTSTDPEIVAQEAIALSGTILFETLSNAIQVAGAGVETIIFHTLPTGGFFPVSAFIPPEVIALGEQIVPLYNFNLDLSAQVLAGLGIEGRVVDFAALTAEVQADPTGFGFVAPFIESTFTLTGGQAVIVPDGMGGFMPFLPSNTSATDIDPDQIAFIDLLHPTTALHGILGAFEAASLTREVVFGAATADASLFTGGGDDVAFGAGGNDRVNGARGDDVLFGGLGDDVLIGFDGDDILSGGSGNDRLIAGDGADVLGGASGDDLLLGGAGHDVLIGGLGSDRLVGGAGDDLFLYTEAALLGGETGVDSDRLLGGQGQDRLLLALTDDTRALVEAELNGASPRQTLETLGLEIFSIETIVFVDSRLAFSELAQDQAEVDAMGLGALGEADLWGVI